MVKGVGWGGRAFLALSMGGYEAPMMGKKAGSERGGLWMPCWGLPVYAATVLVVIYLL